MKLTQYYLTKNNCFIKGKKHVVRGLMLHSTGVNNTKLSRYVGPDDGILGVNKYGNHWNTAKPGGRSVCVHGFIGTDKNGTIRTYQTLPWDYVGWHSGSGRLGSSKNANNNGYIGIEICEDNLKSREYFNAVYQETVEVFAYLCKKYNLDPLADIICHSEGNTIGVASNHSDVMHWFPKHGKDMNIFREDVRKSMGGSQVVVEKEEETQKFYRVQVGAFSSKLNAKKLADKLKKAGFDSMIKYD